MKDKLIIAGGLIVLLATVITCNRCWVPDPPPVVVERDTVYVPVKDTSAWHKPEITVYEGGQIPDFTKPVPVRIDSFIRYEYVRAKVDTQALLNDYYAKVYYEVPTKVSLGTVTSQIHLSKNRIDSMRLLTDFQVPHETTTITIREPPRIMGFLTGAIEGTSGDPLQAASAGVMVQFKNYDAVELSGKYHFQLYPGQPPLSVEASYKKLITFRKPKN